MLQQGVAQTGTHRAVVGRQTGRHGSTQDSQGVDVAHVVVTRDALPSW